MQEASVYFLTNQNTKMQKILFSDANANSNIAWMKKMPLSSLRRARTKTGNPEPMNPDQKYPMKKTMNADPKESCVRFVFYYFLYFSIYK